LNYNLPDHKILRNFGILIGGIFLSLGFFPEIKVLLISVYSASFVRFLFVVFGSVLFLLAFLAPASLQGPFKVWMAVAEVLGRISSKVMLGGIFFLVIFPMGILRRFFGGDALGLSFDGNIESYRVASKVRRKNHMKNQF